MEVARSSWLAVVAWAALALGCRGELSERTQIMLVVDSDLAVPTQLDSLELAVQGPRGAARLVTAALGEGESALPRSLALVHEGGPLGPLRVTVSGLLQKNRVVERRAELAFVEGKTLVLPVHLLSACVSVSCGEQTCTELGCRAAAVDPQSLAPWRGEEPRLRTGGDDGGAGAGSGGGSSGGASGGTASGGTGAGSDGSSGSDAGRASDVSTPDAGPGSVDGGADSGMCMPVTELCNQKDDNCNGMVDESFDFMSDPNHCGGCDVRCVVGANKLCCKGTCQKACN